MSYGESSYDYCPVCGRALNGTYVTEEMYGVSRENEMFLLIYGI